MKTLNIFLAIVMAASTFSVSNAQTKSELQKETFKVWGNCGMCQARIEKAAKEAGATTASWNDETKLLSVSFAASKTSLKAIEEKIASVGHDTKTLNANDEAYNKLHGCCKYERKTTSDAAVAACCKEHTKSTCENCSKATTANHDCCKVAGTKDACCGEGKACCSK